MGKLYDFLITVVDRVNNSVKSINDKSPVNGAFELLYSDLKEIPEKFPPESHTHSISDVSELTNTLNNKFDSSRIQFGNVYVSITKDSTTATVNATFSKQFAGNPTVVANIANTKSGTYTLSVDSISSTGCTLTLYYPKASNNGGTRVHWIAAR